VVSERSQTALATSRLWYESPIRANPASSVR
jgi:hypothetical protein